MSYALVGSLGAASTGSSGGALTPAYGQSPTANSLLILWVVGGGAVTAPGTPAGWSVAVKKAGNSGCTASIFYLVAAGGDAAPLIASISGITWSAMLGEFSGNNTAIPLDQTGSGSGTTSPTSATNAAADAASGELLIACSAAKYSANSAETLSDTLATVSSTHDTTSAASTVSTHYGFAWGITTSNAGADSDSWSFTTTNVSATAVAVASFKLLAPSEPIVMVV